MGLFGGPTKTEYRVEPVSSANEEQMMDVPSLPKPRDSTVIAKGVTLTGAIEGKGVVEVEGVVDGEIELTGSVIVTPTGLINGPIKADVIRVAGRIEGCVTARDHLRLEKTGSLVGDVTTASLVVEDGGQLNGRTAMVAKEPENIPLSRPAAELDDLEFGPTYKIGEEEDAT